VLDSTTSGRRSGTKAALEGKEIVLTSDYWGSWGVFAHWGTGRSEKFPSVFYLVTDSQVGPSLIVSGEVTLEIVFKDIKNSRGCDVFYYQEGDVTRLLRSLSDNEKTKQFKICFAENNLKLVATISASDAAQQLFLFWLNFAGIPPTKMRSSNEFSKRQFNSIKQCAI